MKCNIYPGWFKIKCSLCPQEFPVDKDINLRKKAHARKHFNCRKEKRNTTEGVPTWIVIPAK